MKLTSRQRVLAAKAAALQAVVVPAVRLFGYGRVRALLGRLAPLRRSGPRGEAALSRAREAAWVAGGVARRVPPRATCVPRSLVLWALLRGIGIDARIRFGARRAGETIEAHAWVEVGGEAVGEGAGARGRFPPLE